MPKILKKDIIIPKGTIFYIAPTVTNRHGSDHYEHVIGLTNNSCDFLTYCILMLMIQN